MTNDTPAVAVRLTQDLVGEFKTVLRTLAPQIRSTHLTEAIAAAFGFKSNAALRAALKDGDVDAAFDLDAGNARLDGLGVGRYPRPLLAWGWMCLCMADGAAAEVLRHRDELTALCASRPDICDDGEVIISMDEGTFDVTANLPGYMAACRFLALCTKQIITTRLPRPTTASIELVAGQSATYAEVLLLRDVGLIPWVTKGAVMLAALTQDVYIHRDVVLIDTMPSVLFPGCHQVTIAGREGPPGDVLRIGPGVMAECLLDSLRVLPFLHYQPAMNEITIPGGCWRARIVFDHAVDLRPLLSAETRGSFKAAPADIRRGEIYLNKGDVANVGGRDGLDREIRAWMADVRQRVAALDQGLPLPELPGECVSVAADKERPAKSLIRPLFTY